MVYEYIDFDLKDILKINVKLYCLECHDIHIGVCSPVDVSVPSQNIHSLFNFLDEGTFAFPASKETAVRLMHVLHLIQNSAYYICLLL
jgi:hypothetical protein